MRRPYGERRTLQMMALLESAILTQANDMAKAHSLTTPTVRFMLARGRTTSVTVLASSRTLTARCTSEAGATTGNMATADTCGHLSSQRRGCVVRATAARRHRLTRRSCVLSTQAILRMACATGRMASSPTPLARWCIMVLGGKISLSPTRGGSRGTTTTHTT